MRISKILVPVLLAGLIASDSVNAQTVKKGENGLQGIIVSAGVTVPANGSVTVYTAPAAGLGFFVLTQVCRPHDDVDVRGSAFGPIAVDGDADCTVFEPGIAIPPGDDTICTNRASGSRGCTITGILTRN